MVMNGMRGNALRTSGKELTRTNHQLTKWAISAPRVPDLSDIFYVTSLQHKQFKSASDLFPVSSSVDARVTSSMLLLKFF